MNRNEVLNSKIVLFDGVCNLCSWSVSFVVKRDKNRVYKFAWAQSDTGRELLKQCDLPENFLDTVIYIENGTPYYKSEAALKIAKGLSMPWPIIARLGMTLPQIIRDSIYDWIAKNRYRWFGKTDVCMVPTKDLQSRFL